jgi:3-mercaptopyruvate sulfurtransferase SseA
LVDTISPDALARRSDCLVVDLGSSRSHLRGHVPGAWFAVRSQIQEFPEAGPIVLASEDGVLATFAAADIRSQTDRPVLVLEGGTDGWSKAGLPLEAGLERLLTPVIDRYRRPYEGTDSPAEAMQAYLDWEFGLVAQLERDGTHGFFVI